MDTKEQFDTVITVCRSLFEKKLEDYGASWRIMRPESVTDQIFIKAKRIRSLETKGSGMIGEDIRGEFIAIVNYGVIGLIQLQLGFSDTVDIDNQKAVELYDIFITRTKELMYAKNYDYDEAWRDIRITSCTDIILQKIYRTKQIENNKGKTIVSEGIDANYSDMINYSLFSIIKLDYEIED
ncbi:MAG: DUF1599 domain-containing protein [Dysgonamonadaceae bacterium]|jgi:hypothetical protein|nr:DUF1599 domain-containing protein [Dysgonamonadaceae bacterium]